MHFDEGFKSYGGRKLFSSKTKARIDEISLRKPCFEEQTRPQDKGVYMESSKPDDMTSPHIWELELLDVKTE